jgi:hypothetical protein
MYTNHHQATNGVKLTQYVERGGKEEVELEVERKDSRETGYLWNIASILFLHYDIQLYLIILKEEFPRMFTVYKIIQCTVPKIYFSTFQRELIAKTLSYIE